MRPSFVRLVIGFVLASWAVGFVVIFLYSRSRPWTDEQARRDGVFLVHDVLEQESRPNRAQRLSELQEHFSVDFSLITTDELERRIDRRAVAGERIARRVGRVDHVDRLRQRGCVLALVHGGPDVLPLADGVVATPWWSVM